MQGKGTLKIDIICHTNYFYRGLHFSKTENRYLEDPCQLSLALTVLKKQRWVS